MNTIRRIVSWVLIALLIVFLFSAYAFNAAPYSLFGLTSYLSLTELRGYALIGAALPCGVAAFKWPPSFGEVSLGIAAVICTYIGIGLVGSHGKISSDVSIVLRPMVSIGLIVGAIACGALTERIAPKKDQ